MTSAERVLTRDANGLGKVVFARLAPKEDLMEGIKEVCRREGIRNGVILTCIGSLEKLTMGFPLLSRDPEAVRNAPKTWEADTAVSMLAGQGLVCRDLIEGHDYSVHLHACFRDNNGNTIGQHVEDVKGGSIVFNTVELVIADLGIDLIRRYDSEVSAPITTLASDV